MHTLEPKWGHWLSPAVRDMGKISTLYQSAVWHFPWRSGMDVVYENCLSNWACKSSGTKTEWRALGAAVATGRLVQEPAPFPGKYFLKWFAELICSSDQQLSYACILCLRERERERERERDQEGPKPLYCFKTKSKTKNKNNPTSSNNSKVQQKKKTKPNQTTKLTQHQSPPKKHIFFNKT